MSQHKRFGNIRWRLGLRWQVLGIFAMVLFVLSATFYGAADRYFSNSFDRQRQRIYEHNGRQLDSLIQLTSNRLRTLTNQLPMFKDVLPLLHDPAHPKPHSLDGLWWTLQINENLNGLALFDQQGQTITTLGSTSINPAHVRQAIQQEQSIAGLECAELCELNISAPLLDEGQTIGAASVSVLLSDLVIEFSRLTGEMVTVMTDQKSPAATLTAASPDGEQRLFRNWKKWVHSGTGLSQTLPVLHEAARSLSFADLQRPYRLLLNDNTYEITVFPRDGIQLILLSNLTRDVQALTAAKRTGTLLLVTGFILAMLFAYLLLTQSSKRFKALTKSMQLLAESRFVEVDKELGQRPVHLFQDETDLLREDALALSRQLQSLQQGMHERAEELKTERDFSQLLLNNVEAIIVSHNMEARLESINEYGAQLLGIPQKDLIGSRIFWEALKQDSRSQVRLLAEMVTRGEGRVEYEGFMDLPNKQRCFLLWRHMCLKGETPAQNRVVSIGTDMTKRKAAEDRVTWLANHDALTGLNNRYSFNQFLETFVNGRQREPVGVLFFDLDGFKTINDTSGHHVGDALLKQVALVLKSHCRAGDILARLGGDEFAVISRSVTPFTLGQMAERFCQAMSEVRVRADGLYHDCTTSIGGAITDNVTKTADALLINADLAMYEAKRAGKNQWKIHGVDNASLELDEQTAINPMYRANEP